MATVPIDVGPGTQAWPDWQAGKTYRLLGGVHRKGRIDLASGDDNVHFILQPGFVHDGGLAGPNALYGRGGCTGTRFSREGVDGPDPIFRNFLKSVFYFSDAGHATPTILDGLWSGWSGSDETPTDPADGPQDHGIYMDGGSFVLLNCRFAFNTGAGVHPYSGSGKTTNVTMDGVEADGNGFDGVHCGAASGVVIADNMLLHDNGFMHSNRTGWGWRNYNDTAPANEFRSGYVWNNRAGAIKRKENGLELIVRAGVVLGPPPATPPPPPPPPPPDEEPAPVPNPNPCAAVEQERDIARAERDELALKIAAAKAVLA